MDLQPSRESEGKVVSYTSTNTVEKENEKTLFVLKEKRESVLCSQLNCLVWICHISLSDYVRGSHVLIESTKAVHLLTPWQLN